MVSFSIFRQSSGGAKRSMGRSLSNLGLFACSVAVVGAGIGCGGGTKYADNGGTITDPGTTPVVVNPLVVAGAPILTSINTRGTIPIAATRSAVVLRDIPTVDNQFIQSDVPTQYFEVSASGGAKLNFPGDTVFVTPFRYADRQFVRWELNGTSVGTGTTLSVGSLAATNSGPLKAVYGPYNPGSTIAFTPNYNNADNPRWATLPVTIYVDPSVTPSEGARVRFFAGLDRWKIASGGLITYTVVSDNAAADISFYTTKSFDFLAPGVQGVTFPKFVPSTVAGVRGTMTHADIYLLSAMTRLQNAVDIRRYQLIVTHEYGHALGIISSTAQGHSPNPDDTMYFTGNDGVEQLTAGDMGTIANIYHSNFDGTATAGITRSRRPAAPGTEVTGEPIACRMEMKDTLPIPFNTKP